jgi:hypothetical protein
MVITNENFIDSAPGQKDAIRVLAHQDFIDSVEFVSHSHYGNQEQDFVQVMSALLSVKYDVVMIWSPKIFPETVDKFEQLIGAIGGKPIYYWEGDPWTKTGVKKWDLNNICDMLMDKKIKTQTPPAPLASSAPAAAAIR